MASFRTVRKIVFFAGNREKEKDDDDDDDDDDVFSNLDVFFAQPTKTDEPIRAGSGLYPDPLAQARSWARSKSA